MDEARSYAQQAVSSSLKSDSENVKKYYMLAIETAKNVSPTNSEIGAWYDRLTFSMNFDVNFEELKKVALEYLIYAESIEDPEHIYQAYDKIVEAISKMPNHDKQELAKYKGLKEEANRKKMEKMALNIELSNPFLNAQKVKAVLKAYNIDVKVNKEFNESELEEALKTDVMKIMSMPDFYKKYEESVKKLVFKNQVLRSKQANSANEGKSWGELGMFSFIVASMGKDGELADFGIKYYEKGASVLEKIDKFSNDLNMLLMTGKGFLNQFPQYTEKCKEWEKRSEFITKEIQRVAKEKELKVNKKLTDLEEAKDTLNQRMTKIEIEHKQMGEKFEKLRSGLNLCQESIEKNNQTLKEIAMKKEDNEDEGLLNSLLNKEKLLLQKKAVLKRIGQNSDLTDYYNAIMQELEAIYIGARAVASGKVEASSSSPYQDAADFASNFIEMIPVVGKILSSVASGVAYVADSHANAVNSKALKNISEIATTIQIFNEFCEELVVGLVKKNEEKIKECKGEIIEKINWLDLITQAKDTGSQVVFDLMLKEDDKKAKLLGKADAVKTIELLQGGQIKINPGEDCVKIAAHALEIINFETENEEEKVKTNQSFCQSCLLI